MEIQKEQLIRGINLIAKTQEVQYKEWIEMNT
jgi:hypothetical protein